MTEHSHPSYSDPLESRLEFETLISDLSSGFINLAPGDVDNEIEGALRQVCEFLGIDLAVVWQWSGDDHDVIAPTHGFPALHGLQPPEPLSEDQYPWTRQRMLAGRTVVFSSLTELPPEAAVDVANASLLGIKSCLCLPLAMGGALPVGALAFNTVRTERDWPVGLVKRLQIVVQIFTNALAHARADEALRASETRLAAGAHLAGLAFYEVDFVQGEMYVDDQVLDLCGIPPEHQAGLRVLDFWLEHLHPDDRERVLSLRQRLHDGELDHLSLEYRYLHPTRGETWLSHLARAVCRNAAGRAVKTFGVLRGITESKRVEEELRDLSRSLIRAHEEERALLARELHDDVSQRMAVLAINVGSAELAAPVGSQREALRSVREGLTSLSEDIHSLAYHLHPSVLDELGLAEALRAECERRSRQNGFETSIEIDPTADLLGKDAALCLFRVAQGALSNVARHSQARVASVTLRQKDGGLVLAVHDDGVGFDPARPNRPRSLGLASMRERARLVNGTLDIDSAPGRGATVTAWVPSTADAP